MEKFLYLATFKIKLSIIATLGQGEEKENINANWRSPQPQDSSYLILTYIWANASVLENGVSFACLKAHEQTL